MKLATTHLLYEYWDDVRGDRLAPTRFEIEPAEIASVLSETFILERSDDGGYPFRLAGTRICDQIGRELRGTDFLALAGVGRPLLSKALESVTFEGAVAVLEFESETADGRTAAFEAVVMPLSHPADEITRYLGAFAAIAPPAWLGTEPLARLALVAHDVLWPEGRTFALSQAPSRQLPLSPELAGARVVRSDRRQFRILDGGRKS